MSPEIAKNERALLISQIRFLRLLVIGLMPSILGLICVAGYLVLTQVTHIVPPEVKRPYELGGGHANSDYLTDMANYVLDKVLTVTPETVDYNNKVILKMAHPDGFGALKTTLDAAAIRVKQDRISTIWVPRTEKVMEQAGVVEVSGLRKTFIADKLTSQTEKTYIVQFSLTTSGRLYVSKIEEMVKRDTSAAKPAAQ